MAAYRNEAWPLLNARAGNSSESNEDPLFLSTADNPGIQLVSHQLSGSNFLAWKRSMMIALGEKTKLGFINGSAAMPERNDVNFDKWKKVDWTVMSWILNSMTKEIADSFVYSESAKELWDEICQRFGEIISCKEILLV
ncbi:Unknown protein [Striga hermonthica]|uniref:Retrotransposon Copia-like N-terminal domain-containing protein n=1 Tax=Striga hermonthica TaxID=68872 RepID=A0A9N7NRL0_STRHE|nr:Unknown protein [Striga hermonthica]